jgi:Ser/Thr protein kinase RdoA (MazF antagonist)
MGQELDALAVERIVNCDFGGAEGSTRRVRVRGPYASSEFTQIFRGEGDLFPCPIAIKVFRGRQFDVAPADAARTYYDALKQLVALNGDDRVFGAVRPLGLIEDRGIVVAEWIDGQPLSLWLSRASREDVVQALQRAGAWLARLQRASGVAYRPMDIAEELERLDQSMDPVLQGSGSAQIFRAAFLVHATAAKLAGEQVLWSQLHGDFKPANLIVRERQLYAIDVDLISMAPTVHDVAHFLNHLRLLCYSPYGLRLAMRVSALEAAFCEGYASDGTLNLSPRLLAWERLRNAVHLLLRHREWSRPPRSWLTNFALLRLVRQLTGDLVRATGPS